MSASGRRSNLNAHARLNEHAQVGVIGAGAWGTALARLLASKGAQVRLWAYEAEVVEAVTNKHENTEFLPGVSLPLSLKATSALSEAVEGAAFVVFAVPSHVARAVLQRLAPFVTEPVPIINVTKGIEAETLKLMTQIMEETLPSCPHRSFTVLSGPSFAAEVSREQPTAVVLAGEDTELVRRLQAFLMTPAFRVYAGTDVMGVQLGGALKNVVALAAGVVDGLGLGHNARAALITRGLTEMVRLGTAMGADPRTFYGLSGMGDLVLTCTGPLSRNYQVGQRIGQGESLAKILRERRTVAEGVRTSRAAQGLAARCQVEVPIVEEVCAVLFDGKSSQQAVTDLMKRVAKDEVGG